MTWHVVELLKINLGLFDCILHDLNVFPLANNEGKSDWSDVCCLPLPVSERSEVPRGDAG